MGEEMMMQKGKGRSMVQVEVNVTKIVKYVCIAGVMIVAIIFGVGCYRDMIGENSGDE